MWFRGESLDTTIAVRHSPGREIIATVISPAERKELKEESAKFPNLMKTTPPSFHDIANKSGQKNAHALWAEATEQQQKGWLNHPSRLSNGGNPYALTNFHRTISLRFGVEQSDKVRVRDDLRHARTNMAFAADAPIKLVRWDRLTELPNRANTGDRDWAFSKSDHESSYKQLPPQDNHAKLAVSALRSPVGDQRYGLISRTMMYGAIAAVLHYNVFTRMLPGLFATPFGIPLLSLFLRFRSDQIDRACRDRSGDILTIL